MMFWFVHRTRDKSRPLRLLLILATPGAAFGALALGIALRFPAWIASAFDSARLFGLGIMAYGALAGLVGAYALLVRFSRFPVAEALDRLAPTLGALVFFGRMGCFFAGCDFGVTGNVPWAIRYPRETAAFLAHAERGLIPLAAEHSLAVHPAQMYEAAVGVLMALAGILVERRNKRPGSVLAAVAATYAAGRFVVDGFRGDGRPMLGPLSLPQWLSIAVLGWALLWFVEGNERDDEERVARTSHWLE